MSDLNPKQIIERVERLKGERSNWEQHWQEIANFMLPRKDTIVRMRSPGEKRNTFLLDNTAMMSGTLLAAALHSMLTNPTRPFFGLSTGDAELDLDDEVRLWLQDTTRRMHVVLNNSNFQTEVQEMFVDVVFFATAGMCMEEDAEDVVRFRTHNIVKLLIAENNRGVIDEIYIPQMWTAANLVREFGEDKVGMEVRDQFRQGRNEKFEVIQAIYPRESVSSPDSPFAFISQWILRKSEIELRRGGFREFPFLVPRWSKSSGETYGRGPGMQALPDAKTMNKMDEVVLIAAQKAIDPPLQMEDDGVVMPIRTRPGGLNFRRPGSQPITPIFANAPLDFGFQASEERRARIRRAFFIDELKLAQDTPQMTATEVLQRAEDSMRLLGPVLARFQKEFLKPMVDRLFDIMLRRDMFNAIPQQLSGANLNVQFNSIIAKAQRITEGQSLDRFLNAIAPALQIDPSAVDNINTDQWVKQASVIHEPPQEVIRTQAEVDQIREGRAQAQQAQIEAQQQQMDADAAAKNLAGVAQLEQAEAAGG
jgi:hypothetical protein